MAGKAQIKKLTPIWASQAVDCIAESFAFPNADPFSKALKLSRTQWGIMSSMFVQRAAKKDISFVALHKDSVVGVIINEDWKEAPPEFYKELEDWAAVRAMFHELRTRYKSFRPRIEEGKILHSLYFTCIKPEFRGQGLVSDLLQRSIQVARDQNFETMVAEAAIRETEKVLADKLGFKQITSVNFREFMFRGEHPFGSLPPDAKLGIFERSITSDLFI